MKTAAFTQREYQGFQKAYDFFNRELFEGSLPHRRELKHVTYNSLDQHGSSCGMVW
jgi:hypothetical protein